MKRSGFLRRVVILIIFAWCMHHFVLSGSQYIEDEQQREFLYWFMFAVVGFGVVTMLAERLRSDSQSSGQGDRNDNNYR